MNEYTKSRDDTYESDDADARFNNDEGSVDQRQVDKLEQANESSLPVIGNNKITPLLKDNRNESAINLQNQENNRQVISYDIRNDVITSNNGRGNLTYFNPSENDAIKSLVNIFSQVNNRISVDIKDSDYVRMDNYREAKPTPFLKQIYNNDLHNERWDMFDYENNVQELPPMLDYYDSVSVETNSGETMFASFKHEGVTLKLVKWFLPYYQINEELFTRDNSVRGVNLKLVNKIAPVLKSNYYSMAGKTSDNEGTNFAYSTKFNRCFNFTKTYRINPHEEHLRSDLANMIDVMADYKKLYTDVDGDYRIVFNYSLDTIAHFFLESGFIPNRKEFTLDFLKKNIPPETMKGLLFMKVGDLRNLGIYDEYNRVRAAVSSALMKTSANSPVGGNSNNKELVPVNRSSNPDDEITNIPYDYYTCRRILNGIMGRLVTGSLISMGSYFSDKTGKLHTNSYRPKDNRDSMKDVLGGGKPSGSGDLSKFIKKNN